MSVRYGIGLVPEPAFTARVYQARQIICGQYACWAAEMFPVHLPLAMFFRCPEEAVAPVSAGLERIAGQTRGLVLRPESSPVAALPGAAGGIALDLVDPVNSWQDRPIRALQQAILQMLAKVEGVAREPQRGEPEFRPQVPLMQEAALPPDAFQGAVEFAKGVVREVLGMGQASPRPWTMGGALLLMRLESIAADAEAGGWEQGRWARDLRWSLTAACSLKLQEDK
jgi:hypothetical protein